MYFKRMVNKIVITRPTVSTEDNGFLPGTEKEKMEPWLVPIRSNMRKVYNKPDILTKMENDVNEISLDIIEASIAGELNTVRYAIGSNLLKHLNNENNFYNVSKTSASSIYKPDEEWLKLKKTKTNKDKLTKTLPKLKKKQQFKNNKKILADFVQSMFCLEVSELARFSENFLYISPCLFRVKMLSSHTGNTHVSVSGEVRRAWTMQSAFAAQQTAHASRHCDSPTDHRGDHSSGGEETSPTR